MEKSPRVFVVDPDPDVRFEVQRLVPQAGFTVCGAAGLGTEAVAQAVEAQPNIVLCGLKEPLARVERTIESIAHALPDAPIIAYADSGEIAMIRTAMIAGARDFLPAPFKPEELRRSLSAILEWEERRQLRDAGTGMIGPQGAIITVFGAKGGVGKTMIAANLAVALVKHAGQSVVLVDADDAFGDAAAVLSLTPEVAITDALRNMDGLEGAELQQFLSQHESGLAVAPAPDTPFEWRGLPGELLENFLQRLARRFDVVIVDSGGTLSEVSQSVLEAASLVLWVTTPEYASVRDTLQAFQAVRSLRVTEDRIRIVLNATFPEVEVRTNSIEEALGKEIFWTVPYDRLLRRSAQVGKPIVETQPDSPAAQSLTELALVLSGMPRQTRGGDTLLQRLRGGRTTNGASRAGSAEREKTKR